MNSYLAEVAVLEVLHGDEVVLVGRGAHAEHARDVGVLQDREQPHLADEV